MSNVQSIKKTPQIRFRKFNEDWEEKELGKVCNFSKGHGYSKKDLTQEGTPVYLYGQMYTNYKTAITQSDTYVQPQSDSVYSTGKEVILPGSGETPEDIARATAVLSKGIILGGDINIVYPPKDLSQIFLALSISYEKNRNKLAEQAQGATISHLHNADIAKLCIAYPCLNEQNKIGTLFSQIDSLIASTQKEHDKLVTLKKCMLQKMFPKKGSLLPEIRFKGFNTEWIESELTNFIEPITERNGNTPNRTVLSVSNKYGLISQADLFSGYQVASDDQSNYKVLRKNEFAYNPSRVNVGSIAKLEKYEIGILSPMYELFKTNDKLIPDFFINYFQTNDFKWKMNNSLSGSVRQSLALDSLKLFRVKIPSLPEQQKIGTYFHNLDNIISKQEEELEKITNIKKTLLNKMFV